MSRHYNKLWGEHGEPREGMSVMHAAIESHSGETMHLVKASTPPQCWHAGPEVGVLLLQRTCKFVQMGALDTMGRTLLHTATMASAGRVEVVRSACVSCVSGDRFVLIRSRCVCRGCVHSQHYAHICPDLVPQFRYQMEGKRPLGARRPSNWAPVTRN